MQDLLRADLLLLRNAVPDLLTISVSAFVPIVSDLVFHTNLTRVYGPAPPLRSISAWLRMYTCAYGATLLVANWLLYLVRTRLENWYKRSVMASSTRHGRTEVRLWAPASGHHYISAFGCRYELLKEDGTFVARIVTSDHGRAELRDVGQLEVIASTPLSQEQFNGYVQAANLLTRQYAYSFAHHNCHRWVDVFLGLLNTHPESVVIRRLSVSSFFLPNLVASVLSALLFYVRQSRSHLQVRLPLARRPVRLFTPLQTLVQVFLWRYLLPTHSY